MSMRISAATLWRAAIIPISALPLPVLWLRASATGIGVSITANKIKGIRCAHCADCLEAEMTRRHNDANMMAIGAGFTGKNMAERMVEVFLTTEFEGGRHERRVNKMMALEQE